MARRQITDIIQQQDRVREIARIRFGTRKQPNRPGRPIPFPRVTSSSRAYIDNVAAIYGGTVGVWEREGAPSEWEVTVERPLAIGVPRHFPAFTRSYERWSAGYRSVTCDGEMCQVRGARGKIVEKPCMCGVDVDPEDRVCNLTTRFSVAILGVEPFGMARVDTKSFYASTEVPLTLQMLQESGRTGYLRMESRERKVMVWDDKAGEDKPGKRKFAVIVIDAPFLPEEVLGLERPAGMEALNAPPVRPALTAGRVEPRGPQPQDLPQVPATVTSVLDRGPATAPIPPQPPAGHPAAAPTPPPAPEPPEEPPPLDADPGPEEPPLDGEVMPEEPEQGGDPGPEHNAWAESWPADGVHRDPS